MCACLAAMSIYEHDAASLPASLLQSSRVLVGPYDEYLIPPKMMVTIASSVVVPLIVSFLISPSAKYEAYVRLNEVTKSEPPVEISKMLVRSFVHNVFARFVFFVVWPIARRR
jgi:hypothetical protein